MSAKSINDLAELSDVLHIQTTLNTVQLKVLTNAVLSMQIETFPAADGRNIVNRYFDDLKEANDQALRQLQHLLYDYRAALRAQQDNLTLLDQMRARYLEYVDEHNGGH